MHHNAPKFVPGCIGARMIAIYKSISKLDFVAKLVGQEGFVNVWFYCFSITNYHICQYTIVRNKIIHGMEKGNFIRIHVSQVFRVGGVVCIVRM